jgi:hypothetical protein
MAIERMKYWTGGFILAIGCLGVMQFALRSQGNGATVAAPETVAFRLAFGGADKQPAKWDGSITAPAGRISKVAGWRFGEDDRIDNQGWGLETERTRSGAETVLGPVTEKGVIVTAEGALPDTRFEVTTANGKFSFTGAQVPAGTPLAVLEGRVRVERVPSTMVVAASGEDQDHPALAVSGDRAYLAYIEFAHSNRAQESFATMKQAPANFDWLARPAGGDQVKLATFSKSERKWSAVEAVSPAHEDAMRAAVAVDGKKRVWVIWSAQRNGNFDLYARYRDSGTWSPEVRITRDPGVDINPVAATDSNGRVWVAWQAFRGGNLEVMAAAESGDRFTAEQKVSFSPASDWDPAIAAGPRGEIAVTWDTYDKGDYDVYARKMKFGEAIEMEKPVAVAASDGFEARSSAAFDRQGRLWVAFESAGQKWGKDFGVYDRHGICLYLGHTVRVKVVEGNQALETAGPLDDALRTVPGLTGREMPPAQGNANPGMKNATVLGPRNSFPRIAADEQGRIYLSFRSGAGLRSQVGFIWHQYLTWYDGERWARAVEIPQTEGGLDLRPALASIGPGHLLVAAVTDHRARFGGALGEEATGPEPASVHGSVIAAEMRIAQAASPARLGAARMETPEMPTEDNVAERKTVAALRGARVKLGSRQLQLMRGEFHRHTEFSLDGGADGPLIDAYRYLIDSAHMDWGGCCDHDNGGGREYAWWIQQKLTDAYLQPDRYIPMFSYERSVLYPEGHRNVIFTERGIRPLPRLPRSANTPAKPAPDTQMLYGYLRQFKGIVASHTSATQMGTDWRDNDPILEPVVEIYQGERQNYEMPGAPRAPQESYAIGGWRPLGFVSLALQKGYRLGFQASSDHISTHMSYCNLWVTSRTREGVMEAFRKRRIYGATDNILADVRCGEHFMGEEFSLNSAPVFRVHLVGTGEFASVQIIRDGTSVYSTAPHVEDVSFEWRDTAPADGATHYYYVRGEQKDGQLVWVSPMWIKR